VAQALAAQLGSLMDQWWLLLAQLNGMAKAGQLSLPKLAFMCDKPAASLALFAQVAAEAAAKDLTAAGGRSGVMHSGHHSLLMPGHHTHIQAHT
jgi:hypothetical protein